MGGKNQAPPPPDYTPLMNAATTASTQANQIAQENLDWAKSTYADNKATNDQVVNSFLSTQDTANQNAAADRARYQGEFQPLEDSLVNDANTYSSDARKDQAIGAAQSNVAQNFEAQRTSSQRDLEAFGVNPNATRFGALDGAVRTQQAAAAAAAGTGASLATDATGRALRSEAINVGRGYPGQIAGETSTGLQAGTGAVNSDNSTTATGASTMGTGVQWAGQGAADLGSASSIMNSGYTNDLNAVRVNQTASSGIGSLLGAGVGALTSPFSSTSLAGRLFAAEGGPVPSSTGAVTTPGAVPVAASPSRGAAIDDVPAMVTPGEFIVPRDAASWLGEQKLQAMILKARKDKAGAVAKPAIGPAPPTQGRAPAPQPAVG